MVIPSFAFARMPLIHFGPDSVEKLYSIIREYGSTVLMITGASSLKRSGKWSYFKRVIETASANSFFFSIEGEPSPEIVDRAVTEFVDKKIDIVVAIGGGSVVDAGKAISAMLLVRESIFEYLEGMGTKTHSGKKIPFVAIPTTSGTGSESTKNAVLSRTGNNGFKKSLRHDNLVPDIAILDPNLTLSCPAHISAACGMDALTQLMESYVSPKSSYLTDALSFSGMEVIKDSLVSVCTDEPENIDKRGALAYAAFLSGVTLANAGLGIVHGLASVIGGFFNIPHGVVCGTLIAPATRVNIKKLRESDPESTALKKFATIGGLLSGYREENTRKRCDILCDTLDEWTTTLNIPLLSKYGLSLADLDKIAEKAGNKNNPVKLNSDEIKGIVTSRI